jgi:hypothetical protein
MFYKVTFYKVTPTQNKERVCQARTQADGAAPATALRLYSLQEQVEKVERVSVGWTGEGLRAIESAIAPDILVK